MAVSPTAGRAAVRVVRAEPFRRPPPRVGLRAVRPIVVQEEPVNVRAAQRGRAHRVLFHQKISQAAPVPVVL